MKKHADAMDALSEMWKRDRDALRSAWNDPGQATGRAALNLAMVTVMEYPVNAARLKAECDATPNQGAAILDGLLRVAVSVAARVAVARGLDPAPITAGGDAMRTVYGNGLFDINGRWPEGMDATRIPEPLRGDLLALRDQLARLNHAPKPPAAKLQIDPAELGRLRAFAQLSQREAVEQFLVTFGDLDPRAILAGWLHTKGESRATMQSRCQCSRGSVQNALDRFYSKTGFPRIDRRTGPGKTLQLDEDRDAGAI